MREEDSQSIRKQTNRPLLGEEYIPNEQTYRHKNPLYKTIPTVAAVGSERGLYNCFSSTE